MRKWVVSLGLLAAVTGLPMMAQQTATPEADKAQTLPGNASSREACLKFVHAEDMRKNVKSRLEAVREQLKQQFQADQHARPETVREELKLVDQTFGAMIENLPVDDIINAMVDVCQQHFTGSDIEAMETFYATPEGGSAQARFKEIGPVTIKAMNPEQEKIMADKPLPANAPSQDEVAKLFDAMQMRKTILAMSERYRQQTQTVAAETIKDRGGDPRAAEKAMKTDSDPALEHAIRVMTMIYQHYFTAAEVRALTAFHESPTGQKLLAAAPDMASATAKAMMPVMRKVMGTLADKIKDLEEKEKQKSGVIRPNRSSPVLRK